MMDVEIRTVSYERLERQWSGMLRRFASWRIDGYDYDDLYQELRIVLYNAQRSYDPAKGAAFITYLWRACLNKVGKLRYQVAAQKRIPRGMLTPLCLGEHAHDMLAYCSTCHELPYVYDDVEVFELLEGASEEARKVATLALRGETTRAAWLKRGMTPRAIRKGVNDLKSILRGGENQ